MTSSERRPAPLSTTTTPSGPACTAMLAPSPAIRCTCGATCTTSSNAAADACCAATGGFDMDTMTTHPSTALNNALTRDVDMGGDNITREKYISTSSAAGPTMKSA